MKKARTSFSITSLFSGLIAQANLGGGIQPPSQGVFAPPDLESVTILTYVNRTISFLITLMTALAGLFFLAQFFMGAFNWINAGGEAKKVQESRDRITQGIMGLVVIIVAYSVIGLISTVLGIEILNPGQFIQSVFLPSTGAGTTTAPVIPGTL
jgi:hypothetical protein